MTSCKGASKGELVAIYRLEFYKNKKKWKFCKNERPLKKDVPAKQKLNETYRVEDEAPPEVEPPEPLNDAFLETDSDENVKEELKPSPPPPTLRRWKNTILDLKLPEDRDWAIPDVKAERGWEPSVEPVRSYEEEWEDAGWERERWGDDMQCVEQVYASELCLSGQHSRLPVFAGWPAPQQAPADPNMLQHLMQNIGVSKLAPGKPQADSVGPLGQHGGHMGQNVGQMGQNFGNLVQNVGHSGQNVGNLGERPGNFVSNATNLGQNAENLRTHAGNLVQNVDNIEHLGQNIGSLGQNVVQQGQESRLVGQNAAFLGQMFVQNTQMGQILRQKTEILDRNTNQNIEYEPEIYDEPEILKQNLYGNCKIGQIIEQNLRRDDRKIGFEQMEWEPERDHCELGRGVEGGEEEFFVGDACMAGAVAALAEAEGWLTGSLKHFYLEPSPAVGGDASLSSGDSAAFVRGAHARPHSSEVDLVLHSTCECANMSASKLAHMSSASLRDTLRAYTLAARRVLHELRARSLQTDKQQPSVLSRDATRESLPTRDTAPTPRDTTPHAATASDMSHGRGRGRRLLAK